MNGSIDRRLARLEAQQQVPVIVSISRRWVASWAEMQPRLERGLTDMAGRQARGEPLRDTEKRILAGVGERSPSERLDRVLQTAMRIART